MILRGLLLVLAVTLSVTAQNPASAAPSEVSFSFERPGLPVPKFVLTIHEDGTGTYTGESAAVSGAGLTTGSYQPASTGQKFNRPIALTPATVEEIFKTARSLDRFTIACASKAKNIADTGKKTFNYSGPDGQGSCTYNYSDNKQVSHLTDMMFGVAFTLDEGRKLDFMHRYDRLGLYSEFDTLKREVEAKRALELGNIRPSLTSIANDEALMEKVRERAVNMLNMAGDPPK
jgi:hypothetical protein